jgi:hypothetical protein
MLDLKLGLSLAKSDIKLAKEDGNTESVSMPTWREYFGIK